MYIIIHNNNNRVIYPRNALEDYDIFAISPTPTRKKSTYNITFT